MRRAFVLATEVASLMVISTVTAISGELWDRAVDLHDAYGDMVPGRMSIQFDQYNGRGNLLSSDRSEIEFEIAASGEVESHVIFASRNGEDVTADRREDEGSGGIFWEQDREEESDSPFGGLQKSPFNRSEQVSVVVVDTGRSEAVEGVRTRVHLYRHSTGGKNVTAGTVWIAEDSGAPLRLTASISPLPGYISLFRMTQEFEIDTDGRWYMARMEFVAEGNILFVSRRIESEFEFSGYVLRRQEPQN